MTFKPDWGVYNVLGSLKFNSVATSGPPTNKFEFDDVDDYINIGDNLDTDGLSPFSVTTRIDINSAAGTEMIFGRRINSGGTGWSLEIAAGKILFIISHLSSNRILALGTTVMSTSTNYTVTATYDGSKTLAGTKIYLNGVEETLSSSNDTLTGDPSVVTPTYIGARPSLGEFMGGFLWNTAWYSVELSASDVSDVHNGGTEVDLKSLSTKPDHLWLLGGPGDDDTATTGILNDTGTVGGIDGTPINTSGNNIVPI